MISVKKPLAEKFILSKNGNLAYTYHRCDVISRKTGTPSIDSIMSNGWSPGDGKMYGVGLYTCWDLKDQLNPNMRGYGRLIIKFRVKVDGRFLHFDYDVAKMLLGAKYSIVDQMVRLGIYRNEAVVPKFWKEVHKILDTNQVQGTSASMVVGAFYEGCNNGNWKSNDLFSLWPQLNAYRNEMTSVRGVINKWRISGTSYQGSNDFKVLLVYDYPSAIPVGWTYGEDDQGTTYATPEDLPPWKSMLTIRDVNQAKNASTILTTKTIRNGSITRLSTPWSEGGEAALEKLFKDFPWIHQASSIYKDFSINVLKAEGKDQITVSRGVWMGGIFNGFEFGSEGGYRINHGVDSGCVFMAGTFNGSEKDSTFYGVFVGGVFKRGIFRGSWRGGIIDVDSGAILDEELIDVSGDRTNIGGAAGKKALKWKGKVISLTPADKTFAALLTNHETELEGFPYQDHNGQIQKFNESKIQEILAEREFQYTSLDDAEKQQLYDEFKKSYEDATGAAFSPQDFEWRANGWQFYGEVSGGVAVRKQNSGGIKLTASYGDLKDIVNGFKDLIGSNPNVSIWGLMPEKLCRVIEMMTRKDFKRLPGPIVKLMAPYLAKAIGIQLHSVGLDGGVEVDTPSGPMKKFLIGNSVYRAWLKDSIDKGDTSKLPVPGPIIKALKGMTKLMLNSVEKEDIAVSNENATDSA